MKASGATDVNTALARTSTQPLAATTMDSGNTGVRWAMESWYTPTTSTMDDSRTTRSTNVVVVVVVFVLVVCCHCWLWLGYLFYLLES